MENMENMENIENFERVPLISQESPANRNIEKYKKWCCICGIIIIIISIIIAITIFVITITPEGYSNDITIIPYEYQLRHDGFFFKFNYVIESLPTELRSNFKNKNDNKFKQNSFPNEFTRLAEIIPNFWSFDIFTVQEYRYYPNDTFYKVSTANVKMHSLFTSAIDITFNAADNIDPELIEACEYKITWTWIMNGYIWRKCKNSNEQEFTKVSYFKGFTSWGLEFYDLDGNIKYGYTSQTDFWWNHHKRVVVVYPSAPFPPIIPALYSVCNNYVRDLNNRNSRNKRIDN
ncbi:hypothetical protein Glove_99g378 [Diversispora epigaea]|uniref:Uncharacterized protein n=1 Tax=Diversispora epigaea TaxID=1348612 RepID=A0A397JDK0_9GLOM|nr:hypothetical protein Glove_99g378 [Diversispora epigaea]